MKEVLRLFREMGGAVFDTAPTYGLSESVAGELVRELGIENDLFFATKISTGRGRAWGVRHQDALDDGGTGNITLIVGRAVRTGD